MQENILQEYMKQNGKPTLRKISEDTGIQLTRVFRLLNGSQMKLFEYEIFRKKVAKRESVSLIRLASDCSAKLTPLGVCEIETLMERKLKLHNLLN